MLQKAQAQLKGAEERVGASLCPALHHGLPPCSYPFAQSVIFSEQAHHRTHRLRAGLYGAGELPACAFGGSPLPPGVCGNGGDHGGADPRGAHFQLLNG